MQLVEPVQLKIVDVKRTHVMAISISFINITHCIKMAKLFFFSDSTSMKACERNTFFQLEVCERGQGCLFCENIIQNQGKRSNLEMEPPCIKLCRLLPLFTPRGGETGIQVTASLEIVITVLILTTFSVDAL